MCKIEKCEHIIALVAEMTEIPVECIMSSSRRPDVVDARYLAVYIMIKKGIRIYRIAGYMSMTERNVYYIMERFDDRKDYGDPMIEHYYNSILKALK